MKLKIKKYHQSLGYPDQVVEIEDQALAQRLVENEIAELVADHEEGTTGGKQGEPVASHKEVGESGGEQDEDDGSDLDK